MVLTSVKRLTIFIKRGAWASRHWFDRIWPARVEGGGRVMGSRFAALSAIGLAWWGAAAPAFAQDSEFDALIAESSISTPAAIASARSQSAAGDLVGAAATLERALLADPNAHDARLLYAATLCRLDDRQASGVEFAKLEGHEVGNAMWREADEACGGAFRRPTPARDASTGRLSGEAYAGVAYDSDALGAIALQTDFGYTDVRRKEGFAAIAGARLAARARSHASTGGLYGSLSASAKHDISGPDQRFEIGEARAGFGRDGNDMGHSLGAVVRHVRIFGHSYVTEYGGQGEVLLGNAAAHRLRLRVEAVHQDYGRRGPTDLGDGMHFDARASLEARIGTRGFYAAGVGAEYKKAREKSLGYAGARLFGLVQLPAGGNGHYVNLSGTLRLIDFHDDTPLPDRRDLRAFARAAYGLPLVGQLFGEAAVSYTRRSTKFDSTTSYPTSFDLATYRSLGAELRLIWKF
jgi:hypothetical protein